MTGSTYAPQRWEDVEAGKVKPYSKGIQSTISFGTTQDIDTLIADDSLVRGIQFLAKNQIYGDTITIKVIDKDGIYVGAGTVLSTPVQDWNVIADKQMQLTYDSVAPFKLLGGLYLRVTYVSGGMTDVVIEVNFILLKILI